MELNLQKDGGQTTLKSLKYQNYLEEMELKIRYMKNDIEFKRKKLKSHVNSKAALSSSAASSADSSNCSRVDSFNHVSSFSNRHLTKKRFVHNKVVKEHEQTRKWTASSITDRQQNSKLTESMNTLHCSKPCSVPVPSPTIVKSTLALQNRTTKTAVPLKTKPEVKSVFPSTSNNRHQLDKNPRDLFTRNVLPLNTLSGNGSCIQRSKTLPSVTRSVTLPSKVSSSPNLCTIKPTHVKITGSCKSSLSKQAMCGPSSKAVSSRYKVINVPTLSATVKSSVPVNVQSNVPGVSMGSTVHNLPLKPPHEFQLSGGVASSGADQYKYTTKKAQSMNCFFSKSHSSQVEVSSSESPKSEGRSLKLKTAARLVSKYKLKRLSPTMGNKFVSQSTPKYKVKRTSLKFDRRQQNQPASISPHKLDRRPQRERTTEFTNGVIPNTCKFKNPSNKGNVFAKLNYKRQRVLSLEKYASKNFKSGHQNHHFPTKALRNIYQLDNRRNRSPMLLKIHNRQNCFQTSIHRVFVSEFKKQKLRGKMQLSKFKWRRLSQEQKSKQKFMNGPSSRFSWRRNKSPKADIYHQQHLKLKPNRRHEVQATGRGARKISLRMIDGQLYRSSSSKLVKADHLRKGPGGPLVLAKKLGASFKDSLFPDGLSKATHPLKYHHARNSGSYKINNVQTRLAASRVVLRSIAIAAAKYKKDNSRSKATRKYCIFFGRFGKCTRGDQCPFIHDVEKVAVCTRFLRGKCDTKDCPFSHKASVHKMPVCLFYLRGTCVRPSCPYLHVNVNPNAPVCRDFLSGFCSVGEACKKLHSHVCPSFASFGTCHRAEQCPMFHRHSKVLESMTKSTKRQRKNQTSAAVQKHSVPKYNTDRLVKPTQWTAESSADCPLSSFVAQSSFISLTSSTSLTNDDKVSDVGLTNSSMSKDLCLIPKQKIHPSFLSLQVNSTVDVKQVPYIQNVSTKNNG